MKKRKETIILWSVLVIGLLLLVSLSYAAYTSVTSARRVVSTASAADNLFSSNYLTLLSQDYMGDNNAGSQAKYKNISVNYQADARTQAVYISVCNYAQGYLTKWSEKDINYRIEFSLVDLENHETITSDREYTDKSGNKVSGTEILKKSYMVAEGVAASGTNSFSPKYTYSGRALVSQTSGVTQNMYTVFMDTTYADIVGVKIEVITDSDSPAYGGYGLGGVICLMGYDTAAASGWNGEVQEYLENNGKIDGKDSKEYTGFNYEVSGSGAGTVTVTWDNTKFDISKIFLEDMKSYITDQTEKSVSFKVGEDGQNNQFFIQFYRKSEPAEGEKWAEIKSAFTCEFKEAE